MFLIPENVPPMGHMLKASLLGYYFVFWGIYPMKTCIYLCSHRFSYANMVDILLFFLARALSALRLKSINA